MKKSPYQLTFYFGLLIFLIPVFFVLLILFFTFVGSSKSNKTEEPKKEIVIETKKIIVHDTVIIERPKPRLKKEPVIEIQQDTEQITDTTNH